MSEGALRRVVAWVVVLLFVAPFAVLVLRAFANSWRAPALWPQALGNRGFSQALADVGGARAALENSLVVAAITTSLAVLLGWPAARVLGEGRLHRSGPIFLLLALPLLVPPYATGTGLVEWFIRLDLADTHAGLVLAHLVYVLPYVVLLLAPAFGERVRQLEEAAGSLGAGAARRLLLVTVPAVRPSLAVAALLGFLVSWSQYGTSLAVGGGLPMLPLLLVPFVSSDPQVAAALSLLFLAPAVLALVVAARAARAPL